MSLICRNCGRSFEGNTRNTMRWCSSTCRKVGHRKGIAVTDPAPDTFEWSPLNLAVQALYERCAGRHIAGDPVVEREIAGRPYTMPTCLRCGVPIRGKVVAWNIKQVPAA